MRNLQCFDELTNFNSEATLLLLFAVTHVICLF